ncbi:hypothetical protein [Novosphingobium gossypii]|uniref:hypothetical protein n=1 Tax=Novosphingobium gossypii TaxID=1604774 RepID=UPI003D224FCB
MIETARSSAASGHVSRPDLPPPRQQGLPDQSRTGLDPAEQFALSLARNRKGKDEKGIVADVEATLAQPSDGWTSPAPLDRTKPGQQASDDTPVAAMSAQDAKAGAHMPQDAAPLTSPPIASSDMMAEFAARLGLPQAGSAQSHVQFDPRHYTVENVIIDGGTNGGMTLSYETSDDAGANSEQDLRARLEARGLAVESVVDLGAGFPPISPDN